jgi:hypothetical protein
MLDSNYIVDVNEKPNVQLSWLYVITCILMLVVIVICMSFLVYGICIDAFDYIFGISSWKFILTMAMALSILMIINEDDILEN